MKRLLILLLITTQFSYAKNMVYVLVWGSTQTESGAGHTSIAFSDPHGIRYYSSYTRSDGGIIDTLLCEVNEIFNLDSIIGTQASPPGQGTFRNLKSWLQLLELAPVGLRS